MKVLLFWFICFVVYSFLGWICETFFCSAAQRRFVNRGFLNGPFCPIYGFGALLVIGLFSKYENDLLALFLLSMAVTSIVEYIADVYKRQVQICVEERRRESRQIPVFGNSGCI